MPRQQRAADAVTDSKIHLLDVGATQYGDCVLCELDGTTVLIDGSHRGDDEDRGKYKGIASQLRDLLNVAEGKAIHVDLLVVTHGHQDHIGCLPDLVKSGQLTAEYVLAMDPDAAWGRGVDDALDAAGNDAIGRMTAVLREEIRTDIKDEAEFDAFVSDAVALRPSYIAMLDALERAGATVVKFTGDPQQVRSVEHKFASIGMKIHGPTRELVRLTREYIGQTGRDARDQIQDVRRDSESSELELYQRLTAPQLDALDAAGGQGPAINLQSICISLTVAGRNFLFTGDSQLVKPEVNVEGVKEEVQRCVASIGTLAPYAFIKLGHHGSYNAFDAGIFTAAGRPKCLGICTGSDSQHHPNTQTLKFLKTQSANVTWVRTDRNGQSTFEFRGNKIEASITRGKENDASPPRKRSDVEGVPEAPAQQAVQRAGAGAPIELSIGAAAIKIPPGSTLSLTLSHSSDGVIPDEGRVAVDRGPFAVGGGRDLRSNLLFVTSRDALVAQVGPAADAILRAIRETGKTLFDAIPAGIAPKDCSELVLAAIAKASKLDGVVIVGGHEVIPYHVMDCLPTDLRRRIDPDSDDPDDFFVWSDLPYVDVDQDGDAEFPVSRVPDAGSADFLRTALSAGPARAAKLPTVGVRNYKRPFADAVFAGVPNGQQMHESQALTFRHPEARIDGHNGYVMCHGDYRDTSRFWGEDTPDDLEALNIGSIGSLDGAVVFAGCCWGALTVDQPAGNALSGSAAATRSPKHSMALTCLNQGANAFVGCTGAHYSPSADGKYFGGPFHSAFWAALGNGDSPALALHRARDQYGANMPHGRRNLTEQAIEFKIFHEFTCLGLGW